MAFKEKAKGSQGLVHGSASKVHGSLAPAPRAVPISISRTLMRIGTVSGWSLAGL